MASGKEFAENFMLKERPPIKFQFSE